MTPILFPLELPPVVNFIKILRAAFEPIFLCQKKLQSQTVTKEKLLEEKGTRKMLMKLTPGDKSYCCFCVRK